jgi:predicted Zn finger-like uncharacterized protein
MHRMRVECPNCSAAYEVPERLLGTKARALRCARCDTVFEASAPIPEEERPPPPPPPEPERAAPPPPPEPLPEPEPDPQPEEEARFDEAPPAPLVPPPMRERPAKAPILAWGASLLAVGGGVYALFAYRDAVAEAWPPAARLFLWLGMG